CSRQGADVIEDTFVASSNLAPAIACFHSPPRGLEIMVFLHSHGVGTARAVRIFKTYGSDPIQVMSENPYRLARHIRGIAFRTADSIAMRLGIEKTAIIRVRSGISYALTEGMDEGHCGLPTDELVPSAERLLEVPQQLIRTALDLELQEGTVIADRVGE